MKHIVLAIMIIVLGVSSACTRAPSLGEKASDTAHAFLIHSAQIIDKIDRDTPPEGKVYLVIKYEVENLQSHNDSLQQWSNQIILKTNKESYEPTTIGSLDNQLWETSLLQRETKVGYITFTVPEEKHDFKLTFTFPISKNELTYELNPIDKRISINVDYVFTRLEQIERTQEIPLIGGVLTASSKAPIRYTGTILVAEEEISQLLEQTKSLSENAKRRVIEDYLLAHGHCCLE